MSGKTFDAMHDAISVGRMASQMGAQVFFQKLGQIENVQNTRKRKPGLQTHVYLGKTQQKFRLETRAGAWPEILETCSGIEPVRVPEDLAQLRTTIQKLNQWLKEFPARMSQGSTSAEDENLETGYIRKRILRKFVLALTNRAPKHVSAALTWKDSLCAVPDRCSHTSVIEGAETWGQLELEYGMHPLMIPCWCCLLGAVPKASYERYFVRLGPKLLAAAVELEARDGFAPSPVMMAEHLDAED